MEISTHISYWANKPCQEALQCQHTPNTNALESVFIIGLWSSWNVFPFACCCVWVEKYLLSGRNGKIQNMLTVICWLLERFFSSLRIKYIYLSSCQGMVVLCPYSIFSCSAVFLSQKTGTKKSISPESPAHLVRLHLAVVSSLCNPAELCFIALLSLCWLILVGTFEGASVDLKMWL